MNKVNEYKIEDLGVQHPDYFPGCGVAFTSWIDAYVGIGSSAWDALEDALDNIATGGNWDISEIENTLSKIEDAEDGTFHYVVVYLE